MYPTYYELRTYAQLAIGEAIDILADERRQPTLWEAKYLSEALGNLNRGQHVLAVNSVNDAFATDSERPYYNPPEDSLVRRIDLDTLRLALHSIRAAPAAYPIFGNIVLN